MLLETASPCEGPLYKQVVRVGDRVSQRAGESERICRCYIECFSWSKGYGVTFGGCSLFVIWVFQIQHYVPTQVCN